jgi:outer membrane protein assembly factor BamA
MNFVQKKLLLFLFLSFCFLGNGFIFAQRSKTEKERIYINVDKTDMVLLKNAGLQHFIDDNKLSMSDYPVLIEQLLLWCENHGYPFANLSLDSLCIDSSQFSAKLNIQLNDFITFDSIIIRGNAKIHPSFLEPYLGWKKRKTYKEQIVKQIPARLSQLPFLKEIRSSGVEFVNGKSLLFLYIEKIKSSYCDGYIGLVPINEKTGKVGIAGELNLMLRNIFTLGESVQLQWKAPSAYSQNLFFQLNFPYLFYTPAGMDFSLFLDKKDTSYLNINTIAALQYSFAAYSYVKTFFDYTASDVMSQTLVFSSENRLQYFDYRKQLYGIELFLNYLDHIYNPRKGLSFRFSMAVGQLRIRKNAAIDPIYYEGMLLTSMRYQMKGDLKGYIPLHKRWILLLGSYGACLLGAGNIENELIKIGGFHSLRGFSENSLEASAYLAGLCELHFLFARNSYLQAFFDLAWYEKKLPATYFSDIPFGFGIGIAFDTKAGIFNLAYALGRQQNNPISFKTGRIYFGINLKLI